MKPNESTFNQQLAITKMKEEQRLLDDLRVKRAELKQSHALAAGQLDKRN